MGGEDEREGRLVVVVEVVRVYVSPVQVLGEVTQTAAIVCAYAMRVHHMCVCMCVCVYVVGSVCGWVCARFGVGV